MASNKIDRKIDIDSESDEEEVRDIFYYLRKEEERRGEESKGNETSNKTVKLVGKIYRCTICKDKFSTQNGLSAHFESHN